MSDESAGVSNFVDWLPTLMNPATDGKWLHGYDSQVLDGMDMWDSITKGTDSSRKEIMHLIGDWDGEQAVILHDQYYKFMRQTTFDMNGTEPQFFFTSDADPSASDEVCSSTSLFSSSDDATDNDASLSGDSTSTVSSILSSAADVAFSATGLIAFGVTVFAVFLMYHRSKQLAENQSQSTKAPEDLMRYYQQGDDVMDKF
jgi:hypothetical protein